jgi:hypothetical protein
MEKMNANGKEKEKERFPLVEEDDDDETQPTSAFWVVDDTEDEEEEYIPRRRPPPRVPPNSPVGSPPSSCSARSSRASYSSFHRVSVSSSPNAQPTSQSPTPKCKANLDVQDALLAIRLRVFLKAQGVSEADLDVVFDEAEEEDDETMAAEIDRALAEMHAAAGAATEDERKAEAIVVEAENENTTTMEGGMHALPPPPRPPPRPYVPLPTVEKRPIRSSPSPPLVLKGKSSAFGSRNVGTNAGGRTSPSPPPSVSYMIALLTMRHRYASRRRSSAGSPSSGMGYPTWKKGSALKSVAWAAAAEEDVDGDMGGMNGMGTIVEQEEEGEGDIDVDSVLDLYAGL